jgi:hypothetical protein
MHDSAHRDSAPALPDFGDESVRKRLGPSAWKGFGRMMEIWQVSTDEARQLLALPPEFNIHGPNSPQLGEEQMFRISYLLGIYKALHIVHGDELADVWVKLANKNVMFGGQAPLTYMISGGVGAMRNVRRLLDARCAGNG